MLPWLLLIASIGAAGPVDYLVVAPDALASKIAPLVEWRQQGGLNVRTISVDGLSGKPGGSPTTSDIKEAVREEYRRGKKKLKYVLLVGDVGEGGVPTFIMEHYRWMSSDKRKMATDVPYGDMTGSLLPEIAVGRLPVRTPADLETVVRKIIRFESEPREGSQRLNLLFFGGASGFPTAAETFLESISRNMLDSIVPLHYDINVIYGNLASPYCPPPDELGWRFIDFLNKGPALTVFAGHGTKASCLGMIWKRKQSTFLCHFEKDQLAGLKEESLSGPLFYIACDNGFFDDKEDCLAEATLLHPGGPVAAVASSRYSHPLTNLYFAQALPESLDRSDTVGELMLRVLKKSYKKSNPLANMFLRNVEGSLDGDVDVARLKDDQVLIYNLFGDPATKISPPKPLKLTAALSPDSPGIVIKGSSPLEGARGYAALYRARTWNPRRRRLPDPEASPEEWRKAKGELFSQVNDKEVARFPLSLDGGEFEKLLAFDNVPQPGGYRLVLYLRSGLEDVAGAVPLILPAD